MGDQFVQEGDSEEESASTDLEGLLGPIEPVDYGVSFFKEAGDLRGECLARGGGVVDTFAFEGNEFYLWNVQVSGNHVLNF